MADGWTDIMSSQIGVRPKTRAELNGGSWYHPLRLPRSERCVLANYPTVSGITSALLPAVAVNLRRHLPGKSVLCSLCCWWGWGGGELCFSCGRERARETARRKWAKAAQPFTAAAVRIKGGVFGPESISGSLLLLQNDWKASRPICPSGCCWSHYKPRSVHWGFRQIPGKVSTYPRLNFEYQHTVNFRNPERNEYTLSAYKEYGTSGTFGGRATKDSKVR